MMRWVSYKIACSLILFLLVSSVKSNGLVGTFTRISSLSEISDDNFYVLGEISPNSSFGYLLTSLSSQAGRLSGLSTATFGSTPLLVDNTSAVWQIKKKDNHYFLMQGNTGVTVSASDKLSLSLSESPTEWELEQKDNGKFRLKNSYTRYLGISAWATNAYFRSFTEFGADAVDLYIYGNRTGIFKGTNSYNPSVGDTISLCASLGDSIYSYPHASNVSGSELVNGKLAYYTEGAFFKVQEVNNKVIHLAAFPVDNNLDSLVDNKNWALINDLICSVGASDTLFLAFNSKSRSFGLYPLSVSNANVMPAYFKQIDAKPYVAAHNHIKTLKGSWSADSLANALSDGTLALDVTSISLPILFKKFVQPSSNNAIIYALDLQSIPISHSWKNVVKCSNAANELVDTLHLVDREAFVVGAPFIVSQAQMTYERNVFTDGGWETLVLPFSVSSLPADFSFYQLSSIDKDGVKFVPVYSLSANVPYLLRSNNSAQSKLKLYSDAQVLNSGSETAGNTPFCGILHPLVINSSTNYLLSSQGEYFVHAASGSTLAPFRAYLNLSDNSDFSLAIRPLLSGISLPTHSKLGFCYDLWGRSIAKHSTMQQLIVEGGKLRLIQRQ